MRAGLLRTFVNVTPKLIRPARIGAPFAFIHSFEVVIRSWSVVLDSHPAESAGEVGGCRPIVLRASVCAHRIVDFDDELLRQGSKIRLIHALPGRKLVDILLRDRVSFSQGAGRTAPMKG